MKLTKRDPVFLAVCWEAPQRGNNGMVTLEATLCYPHRQEIARMHPSARGCGRLGESCDFCVAIHARTEGRVLLPRRDLAR